VSSSLVNDVLLLMFGPATSDLRKTKPIIMKNNSIKTLTVPKKLLSHIPQRRDMLCNKQQNVVTAIAIPDTFPGLGGTLAASRQLWPKETELAALFAISPNDMPYAHVARKAGFVST
jgi:hypothetical protein